MWRPVIPKPFLIKTLVFFNKIEKVYIDQFTSAQSPTYTVPLIIRWRPWSLEFLPTLPGYSPHYSNASSRSLLELAKEVESEYPRTDQESWIGTSENWARKLKRKLRGLATEFELEPPRIGHGTWRGTSEIWTRKLNQNLQNSVNFVKTVKCLGGMKIQFKILRFFKFTTKK